MLAGALARFAGVLGKRSGVVYFRFRGVNLEPEVLGKNSGATDILAAPVNMPAGASTAFEGRASGMGRQKLSGAALAEAIKAARHDYAAFREIARDGCERSASRAS